MVSLLVIAMVTLFALNQASQNDLVKEIQDSSTAISQLLQKSVESLTSDSEPDTSQLAGYLKEAKKKGIKEINIINNEGEIVDSSDPAKIGKTQPSKKMEKGLKALSDKEGLGNSSTKPYKLVVPVIVGDEQLGYVEMDILLDNIDKIQHAHFVKRVMATCIIFAIGIILIIFLARRYTKPIKQLVGKVQRVAGGDISVEFPSDRKDEIGELAKSFNNMVTQLKERKDLEERLKEAEQLSKLGQLAAGIAHEIRNPLNYISLAVDHLKEEIQMASPEKGQEAAEIAEKIKEEVRKANYMVLNFMNYGRPLKLRKVQVSYRDVLAKALPILKDKLRAQGVSIKTEIPSDIPKLYCDPELFRNCLLNFITNGAQSMEGGGQLILGASYDPSEGFRLTFRDHGNGIPPEDIEKVLQPYFTTKEAGIGLGLAITDKIIKEHGGKIIVESEVGKGSIFTVILPDFNQSERGEVV